MKKVLCNIIVLCFCNNSLAYSYQKPLIQSATADTSEYYAYLSINSDYMAYSEYQLLMIGDAPINDKISNLYLRAQKYYYDKNYFKSLKIFQEIIGLRNKFQMNKHSKKLILNSVAKAYQLSSLKKEQKKLLLILRGTYPYIDLSGLDIPQTLVTKLDQEPLLFNNWEVTNQYNKYKYIIVNGKTHSIYPDKNIKLPKGEFIVSLISDSFFPITKVINKSQLYKWEPSSDWINSGTCTHPDLKRAKPFKNTSIFYKHDCVLKSDSKKILLNNVQPKKEISIKQLKPEKAYSNISYKPESNFKWVKNKWLWIGLGLVATSIAISSNQKKSTKSKGTKKGF